MASVSAVGLSLEGSPQQLSPPSPTSAGAHQISHQHQQEAFAAMNASQAALFGSHLAQQGLLGGLGVGMPMGSPAAFFPAGIDIAALQLRQYNLQQLQQGFNPAQSPLLSPFFASRFFAPTSPSPPSATPLKIKKEDSGGAFQPVVIQHDDTPSPKFARMDYLSASASSGLPATPSTLSSPGSDSFAAAHRSHHKLSQASSGSDSICGSSMLLKGESSSQSTPGLAHFKKGSVIRLGDGNLRTVEQVTTDDLIKSAEATPGVRLDSSKILRMEAASQAHAVLITFAVTSSKQEVSVETPVDRPFFVFNRGWSSCDPSKTLQKLGLQCHKLQPGDVCVTLSNARSTHAEEDSVNDLRRYPSAVRSNRRWSAPDPPTNASLAEN
ncbi:ataxin-1 [Galendromus occidentalis]|uniref:Ataxin-1 n=1 Tax=Galendromus occidentalis TaxID=34638 RepID=A0AAJ6QRE5_9ACAR|nr:ataxin-1 [Galendromus occidentalis]